MTKSRLTHFPSRLGHFCFPLRATDLHDAHQGEEYTEKGQDYYEQRYRERVLRALSQRAAKLGMQMVPVEQPA